MGDDAVQMLFQYNIARTHSSYVTLNDAVLNFRFAL